IGLHTRRGTGVLEIGYWVHRAWTRRGIASAAAGALTTTAFGLHGIERVEIRCDATNAASAGAPQRLGFALESIVFRPADPHAAREARRFSATEGGVVLENLAPEQLTMMRDMLLAMDPPRHGDYRRPLAESFKRKVIGQLEPQIREICRGIMAKAAEQRDVEFVHDVTASLPSRVIGQIMGLPKEDWPLITRLAERNTSGQDPDLNHDDP